MISSPTLAISGKTLLVTSHPKLAFSRAAAWLVPPAAIANGIHPTAVIAATASISPDAAVGPFTVIEDGAQIDRKPRSDLSV